LWSAYGAGTSSNLTENKGVEKYLSECKILLDKTLFCGMLGFGKSAPRL
jgi:hypothetical protein